MEHIATPKVENVFLLDNLNPRNSTGITYILSRLLVLSLFANIVSVFFLNCKFVVSRENVRKEKNSVVDPDPHGSGTFAWIRIRN